MDGKFFCSHCQLTFSKCYALPQIIQTDDIESADIFTLKCSLPWAKGTQFVQGVKQLLPVFWTSVTFMHIETQDWHNVSMPCTCFMLMSGLYLLPGHFLFLVWIFAYWPGQMREMKKYYLESRNRGISYMK